jgi:hypothetical protein
LKLLGNNNKINWRKKMTTIKRIDGSVLKEKEGSIKEVIEELVSTGANLRGAYLTGAFFQFNDEKIEIAKTPLQIDTGIYDVIIFDSIMKIGCEMHSIAEWFSYNNKEIAEMDGKQALKFWKEWKKPLKQICKTR